MDDITPPHAPISLARDVVSELEAKGEQVRALSMAYVWVDDDGKEHLKFDSCGHAKQQVLWALEYMRLELFGVEPNP